MWGPMRVYGRPREAKSPTSALRLVIRVGALRRLQTPTRGRHMLAPAPSTGPARPTPTTWASPWNRDHDPGLGRKKHPSPGTFQYNVAPRPAHGSAIGATLGTTRSTPTFWGKTQCILNGFQCYKFGIEALKLRDKVQCRAWLWEDHK